MQRGLAVITLGGLLLCGHVTQACQLTWTLPTTNTDGSPLTDLDRTRIYFQAAGGTTSVVEIEVPAPTTTATLAGPCKVGTYTATVTNTLGTESDPSNQVLVKKPNKPTNLVGSK